MNAFIAGYIICLLIALFFLLILADGRRLQEQLRSHPSASGGDAHDMAGDQIFGDIPQEATENPLFSTAEAGRLS